MAKYLYLITVNAVEGQDAALNAWLDEHHLPEVLQTEGFLSARRFELPPEEAANPKATHRYMHMYEIETDDLAKTRDALRAGGATRTPLSPAVSTADMSAVFYRMR